MLPPFSKAAAARITLKMAWGKVHSVMACPVGHRRPDDAPNLASQGWPCHELVIGLSTNHKTFLLLVFLINKMVIAILTPFVSESHSISVGCRSLVEF